MAALFKTMARKTHPQVQKLMDEKKETQATLAKVRTDYEDRIILLQKRISDLTKQLRHSECEHEWIRDPYPYAELYCKHCTVWQR